MAVETKSECVRSLIKLVPLVDMGVDLLKYLR